MKYDAIDATRTGEETLREMLRKHDAAYADIPLHVKRAEELKTYYGALLTSDALRSAERIRTAAQNGARTGDQILDYCIAHLTDADITKPNLKQTIDAHAKRLADILSNLRRGHFYLMRGTHMYGLSTPIYRFALRDPAYTISPDLSRITLNTWWIKRIVRLGDTNVHLVQETERPLIHPVSVNLYDGTVNESTMVNKPFDGFRYIPTQLGVELLISAEPAFAVLDEKAPVRKLTRTKKK